MSMTLFDLGALAVGEELETQNPADVGRVRLVAGFGDRARAEEALALVSLSDANARISEVPHSAIDEWAQSRRAWVEPIETANWLVIPPWLADQPFEQSKRLIIDPGSAFGDAGHPTTRLMLALLPDTVTDGAKVADVGTGTGILAIAAASLGARVAALEIDEHAVRVAQANVLLNSFRGSVEVALGDANELPDFDAEVALVNVTIDIHRQVCRNLHSVATIVASGILEHQLVELLQLYKPREVIESRREQDWVAVRLA